MRITAAVLLGIVAGLGCSQGSEPQVEEPPVLQEQSAGLLARASVSYEEAQRIALASTNGGSVEEAELEEEDDLLVYDFEIRTDAGALWEVEVDAMSGEVLEAEMEDDEDDEDEDDDHDGDDDEHRNGN